MDGPAESGEMGFKLGGINVFNEDGQAHVSNGYTWDSSRGREDKCR